MEPQDANMSSSRSEPSHSAPSSPQMSSSIPPPPPLPSLPLLLPAPPSNSEEPGDNNILPSSVGTLEMFFRSSFRQKKWALVLILPRSTSCSLPTSPALTSPRHLAWGPNASHQRNKLFASREVSDNVAFWRRTLGSSDAERYQIFFPTDGLPHVALLDPRSGERLAVWGNADDQNMTAPTQLDRLFWSNVLSDIEDFLNVHSLEDDALGPAHYQEKPWAVRTRRLSERPAEPNRPPTSLMDDEEAAIASAIAASLAEANHNRDEDGDDITSSEESFSEDERSDFYSSDSMTQDDDSSADTGTQEDDSDSRDNLSEPHNGHESNDMDMMTNDVNIRNAPSRPIAIPSRGRDPIPSSVESVSLSYIERMESCFRSRTDPSLIETRRLREEQDAELARSLQEDRRRAQEEREVVMKRALQKEQQLAAEARLPDEPAEGTKNIVTIALRLPGGVRVSRRFNSFDKIAHVADLAIAQIGCIAILDKEPQAVLKMPGGNLKAMGWGVDIGELQLGQRAMFILHVK